MEFPPGEKPLNRDEAFAVVAEFFQNEQYRTGRLRDTASVWAFFMDDDDSVSDGELVRFGFGGGWYDGRNVSFGKPMRALARWFVQCPKMEELHLDRGSIGDEGAIALAGAMECLPNLRSLSLKLNGIEYDGAAALAQALQSAQNLRSLDLSMNPLGDEAVTCLAPAIPKTLEALQLDHCRIGAVGAEALGLFLSDARTSLQQLCLANNNIHVAGASSIFTAVDSHHSRLESLNLRSNNIGEVNVGLGRHSRLVSLDVSHNNLGDRGVQALVQHLGTNEVLESLVLAHNNIRHTGAVAIAASLETNRTMKHLDLSFNNVGNDGAIALAGLLKSSIAVLEEFWLQHNRIDLISAAALLGAKSLRRLDLLGCYFCDADVDFADLEQFNNAIKTCTVRCIDLSRNFIGVCLPAIEALAEVLRANENKFEELYLDHSEMEAETVTTLTEAMRCNESLQHLSLSWCGGTTRIYEFCERNRRLKQATELTTTAVEALTSHTHSPKLAFSAIPSVVAVLDGLAPSEHKRRLLRNRLVYGVLRSRMGGESRLWVGVRLALVIASEEPEDGSEPTRKKYRHS